MTYTERSTCRLCGGHRWITLLDFGQQYLVGFVKEADKNLPQAPLELMYCTECRLIQLRHTVSPDLMWRDYGYRSGVNATMRAALRDVVAEGLRFHTSGSWLDIGANDGTLLFYVPEGFRRVAVEPALNLQTALAEHAHEQHAAYFNADLFDTPRFHVITSCAMFYDLDNPHAFIRDIKTCLADDGVWINQISDTAQMVRQNAFDNICHEHACHYDIGTLERLYRDHGLMIVGVRLNDVNGGSLRVVAARQDSRFSGHQVGIMDVPTVTEQELQRFCNRTVRWKELMLGLLEAMWIKGPIWLYGASTKSAMFLQYLDQNHRFFAAADRNPHKHGLVMAGTWIPITNEETFRKARPAAALVGPWAFANEINDREAQTRANGTTFIYPLPDPRFVL